MLVTLLGISILVTLLQKENAESPMLVIGNPLYSDGIIISLFLLSDFIPTTAYSVFSMFILNFIPSELS